MIIKPFHMNDLGFFDGNEFSEPHIVIDQLNDPAFEVQSLWDGGRVMAILCFRNYWGRNWMGFFLISKFFTPRHGYALKQHIKRVMEERDALRLQTDSIACKTLDRWHRWLGFKWEGCRKKMLFDRDYNAWAILRPNNGG